MVNDPNDIYKRHHTPLFFFILKIVRNKQDAEDVLMITFEKAFRKIHLYKDDHCFSTWLYTIAKHKSIDHLRTKNRRIKHVDYIPIQIEDKSDNALTQLIET